MIITDTHGIATYRGDERWATVRGLVVSLGFVGSIAPVARTEVLSRPEAKDVAEGWVERALRPEAVG